MATHSSILAWRTPWSLAGYSPWGFKESGLNDWACGHTGKVYRSFGQALGSGTTHQKPRNSEFFSSVFLWWCSAKLTYGSVDFHVPITSLLTSAFTNLTLASVVSQPIFFFLVMCIWWTGRPGMLRFMGSQRVGHDCATELNRMCVSGWIADVLNTVGFENSLSPGPVPVWPCTVHAGSSFWVARTWNCISRA